MGRIRDDVHELVRVGRERVQLFGRSLCERPGIKRRDGRILAIRKNEVLRRAMIDVPKRPD